MNSCKSWSLLAGIALLGLLGLPSVALGQSDEEVSVKQAYKMGMTHYKKGEFEEAITDFRKALDQQPHPVLIYNLSQSYVRIGEWEKAVKYADMAQELGGKLDERTATQNVATGLAGRVVLSAEDNAPEIAEAEPGASKPQASTSPDKKTEPSEPTSPPPETAGKGGFGGLGWVGAGTAAAGAGLLAGALVVDIGLASDFEALEEGTASNPDSLRADMKSRQTTGQILLYAGAGAAALGTTLLILELTGGESKPQSARLGVSPTDGGARLQFQMPF
jgi:tetratricopeptide (TPR) repeat protein